MWFCKCSCGNPETLCVAAANLGRLKRATISCGCIGIERAKPINQARLQTHGMRFTKTYRCWAGMKNRGTNMNGDRANDYVGRGIDICERWKKFEHFFEDMGECPSGKYSIDRWPNNESGGYWCGHCEDCLSKNRPFNARWGTQKQQCRGQRSNRLLTFNGETMCIAEWAERLGMTYACLQSRITQLEWPVEKALTTPVGRWPSHIKFL